MLRVRQKAANAIRSAATLLPKKREKMNLLPSGNFSNVKEDTPGLFELSFSQQAFTVGDIVTRAGDDEQVITSIDFDWDTLEVLCIKPTSWIGFGESESNLIRRYQFVRDAAEQSVHLTAFGAGMLVRLAKFVNFIRELLAKYGGR